MSKSVDDDIEALERGTGSGQGKRLIPDSLYMPDLNAPWRKCTVYTSMSQNEFRMYETNPSDPDDREIFLLSAKIYENEGAFISVRESFPSEILNNSRNSTPRNSITGVSGERKEGDDEKPSKSVDIGADAGVEARSKSRGMSEDMLDGPSGAEMFAQQKGGYIAKLERQVDNSFLLCLNTCRYCDYDHGYYECSSSKPEREVGLRVKHSIKKSKFTGDTEIKFVSVALPAFVRSSSAPSSSSSGRMVTKPGTKRAIWCPRTFKNSVYTKMSLGSNVDVETASVASKHSASSKTSLASGATGRSGRTLGPHRQSSFGSQTMNELVQGTTDLCEKCMSKIPDWNPKINSLVTKFHDNRIRFPSSHNVIIYEEATLQEYKSVLKTTVTAAAAQKESAPEPPPRKTVGGKEASPFGKIGNFFSRKEKDSPIAAPPAAVAAPETKVTSKALSPDSAIFQFGKNDERSEEYALDFRGPLSPLQAFAIAISSFADDMVVNYISLNALALARARKKKRGSVGSSAASSPTSSRKSVDREKRREPPTQAAAQVTIFVPSSKPPPPPPMQTQDSAEKSKKRRPSITDMLSALKPSSGAPADTDSSSPAATGSTSKPKHRTSITQQIFGSLSPSSGATEGQGGGGENAAVSKKTSWTSKMFGGGSADKVAPPPAAPPPAAESRMPPAPPQALSVDTQSTSPVQSTTGTPLTSSGPLVRIPAQGDMFRSQQHARAAARPGSTGLSPPPPALSVTPPAPHQHQLAPQRAATSYGTVDDFPRPSPERSRSNSISSTSSSVSYRSAQNQGQSQCQGQTAGGKKYSGGAPSVDVSGLTLQDGAAASALNSATSAVAHSPTPQPPTGAKIPPATAAYMEKRKNMTNLTSASGSVSGSSSVDAAATNYAMPAPIPVRAESTRLTPPSTPSRGSSPTVSSYMSGPPTVTTAGGINTPTKKIIHPPVRSTPTTPTATRRQTPLTSPIVRSRTAGAGAPVPMKPTPPSGGTSAVAASPSGAAAVNPVSTK